MSLTPFKLSVSDQSLGDLRSRIDNTRWPILTNSDDGWERGAPLPYLQHLARYWAWEFDWKSFENKVNRFDQFMFDFEDQPIHFFHVRSADAAAMPLLLLHGWPSSGLEYLEIFALLTAHPGSPGPFHLVVPTIPGFGLSSPIRGRWHSPRTAEAYAALMRELGYGRYGVHGSDIGGDILQELAALDEERVIATHMASDTRTAVVSAAMFSGNESLIQHPSLSEVDRNSVQSILTAAQKDSAYLQQQSTRPLTIGYSLSDSPVGQLAWMVEKYKSWTHPASAPIEEKLDIDQVLANVSVYWLTGSGCSSANFIYDNMNSPREWGRQSNVPRGIVVFDSKPFVRTLLDPDCSAMHWTDFEQGGHFPAMECPELLARDIIEFFGRDPVFSRPPSVSDEPAAERTSL